ncbi:MAG: glycosyltransferase family 4 protein [Bryobacterales bacterium]|nr:glycosyltransferase family 4 protein [Bryobacterales bacterium]
MLHWKGFEFGLRAFAMLAKDQVPAEYWLIGDGPYRARLAVIAAELGIADRVHFWGKLDRPDVLAKVAECDVLVHPSLHDSGGWVCLEAMAAGRPVVCLDLGGPSVQVTTETGFRIPADDPESAVLEIAAVLQRLAENPELRINMGASARGHIREHFTWECTLHKASNMYRRCVGEALYHEVGA